MQIMMTGGILHSTILWALLSTFTTETTNYRASTNLELMDVLKAIFLQCYAMHYHYLQLLNERISVIDMYIAIYSAFGKLH